MLPTQFQLLFSNKYILNYRLVMGKKKSFQMKHIFFFAEKKKNVKDQDTIFLI